MELGKIPAKYKALWGFLYICLMITYIKIHGFKSFHEFEMEFSPLTVIAGTNASGKSNLFDALQLLAKLAEVDTIQKAFYAQRGEFSELFSQYAKGEYAKEMYFCVDMLLNKDVEDAWGSKAVLVYTRLRYELRIQRKQDEDSGLERLEVVFETLQTIKTKEDFWAKKNIPKKEKEHWIPKVKARRSQPYIYTERSNDASIDTIIVPQDGTSGRQRRYPLNKASRTVLSSFDTVDFPHVFAVKKEMQSWKFLQLNPKDLRKPSKKEYGIDSISPSGAYLAAALYRIQRQDSFYLTEISRQLQSFIPNFIDVQVLDDIENSQYLIKLIDSDKKEYSSRVLSEGTLRILTLCILKEDDQFAGLLCFEEPENGIHPVRIEKLLTLLKDLTNDFSDTERPLRQLLVNTHSPVLVGAVKAMEYDSSVQLWYVSIVKRVTEHQDQMRTIRATKAVPVEKAAVQTTLHFTKQEELMTLSQVRAYLQTNTKD